MKVSEHDVEQVQVHLVSAPLAGNLSDATRMVEMIGFLIVKVKTKSGFEGIGVTYHEVGGEATKELILRNIAPRIIGRNPFETEVIFQDLVGYLRGVARKGLM